MKDFIKEHWNDNAQKFKGSHEASWGDVYAILLEIEAISQRISEGDRVLDVGCANGFSALEQCKRTPLAQMVGCDFSEEMIRQAKENQQASEYCAMTEFLVGDVRSLPFEDENFDVVYTTRVLINLPNWEEQIIGIQECIRVAKKGGTVIFSEAFWEPLAKLNALRLLGGLEPLVEHDFNRYLKIPRLENLLDQMGLKYDKEDFSSVFYIGTRFLRELATDHKSYSGFSNPINEDFYKLEQKYSGGGFGVQQLYALTKHH